MNRRLAEEWDLQPQKRYKTTDTRISNSKKLPDDFFSTKKRFGSCSSLTHKRHCNSLPLVKMGAGKVKSL